jgi:hypothetical protein
MSWATKDAPSMIFFTGPCPFEQLDLIIRQETLGLACPWTFGQGDRTSEMQQQRCRLLGEYWKEFHKNLKKMEGPNKPLVKLEREPVDIFSQPGEQPEMPSVSWPR